MQYPPAGGGDELPGFWPENDDFTPITDPSQLAELRAFAQEAEEDDARYEAWQMEQEEWRKFIAACEQDDARYDAMRAAYEAECRAEG